MQRPREGAPPAAGGTAVRAEHQVPPTLAAAAKLVQTATPTVILGPPPSPSPGLAPSPAPVESPGRAPTISGLLPAPGASLPAGEIVIGARVSGSSDLVDVTAFLDGEPVDIEPVEPSVRVKRVSFVRAFTDGTHEVRIQARDERGQLGGYRWQFSVKPSRQPAARPTAPPSPTSPVQARTPMPLPTRRPTVALPTLTGVPTRGPGR